MRVLAATMAGMIAAAPATAADRKMTQAEMTALLKVVHVVKLGGPSSGYYGALVVQPNGRANGIVVLNGSVVSFKGPYDVTNGKFCRTWDKIDPAKRVCETWTYITDTSVRVFAGTKELGVNSW